MIRRRIHHLSMIPGLVRIATYPLRILDAYAQRLRSVRQVGMIKHTKENYRSVFLSDIKWLRWKDPSGDQERKGWNPSDLPSMEVMNLNECLLIAKCVYLTHIRVF